MKAIIVGGTSGIGLALAEVLSANGWEIGITGRRIELIAGKASSMGWKLRRMDVCDYGRAGDGLTEFIAQMGGVDLVVINAGYGDNNTELDWNIERLTVETNVCGFAATAVAAYRYFAKRGTGHLVGISSVAAIRGAGRAPAYGASKAFMSNYLQSLGYNAKFRGLDITVTDIKPGFVNTAMMKAENAFWVAEPECAARQIYFAIINKARHAYVTKRWRIIAWIMKLLPDFIYEKI